MADPDPLEEYPTRHRPLLRAGAVIPRQPEPQAAPEEPGIAELRAKFAGSPALQSEFETVDRYLSYYRAITSGRAKILRGPVNGSH